MHSPPPQTDAWDTEKENLSMPKATPAWEPDTTCRSLITGIPLILYSVHWKIYISALLPHEHNLGSLMCRISNLNTLLWEQKSQRILQFLLDWASGVKQNSKLSQSHRCLGVTGDWNASLNSEMYYTIQTKPCLKCNLLQKEHLKVLYIYIYQLRSLKLIFYFPIFNGRCFKTLSLEAVMATCSIFYQHITASPWLY